MGEKTEDASKGKREEEDERRVGRVRVNLLNLIVGRLSSVSDSLGADRKSRRGQFEAS